ncbi:MAG: hypothetical protein MSIBF_03565 [Candidatus Altiarchaeales archaeon IMC4]|nr:MAG: hypothetical protein MSIBF_03565 [Candidatus Altiarchaeales archaeon IMC4]
MISGLFFKGPERILLKIGVAGWINLVTCGFVIDEVREVIRRKFPDAESSFEEVMTAVTVLKTESDGVAKNLMRDKKDIPVLATSLRYKPDYFVTGDSDFHTPEIKKQLNVVRTQEFLNEFIC